MSSSIYTIQKDTDSKQLLFQSYIFIEKSKKSLTDIWPLLKIWAHNIAGAKLNDIKYGPSASTFLQNDETKLIIAPTRTPKQPYTQS